MVLMVASRCIWVSTMSVDETPPHHYCWKWATLHFGLVVNSLMMIGLNCGPVDQMATQWRDADMVIQAEFDPDNTCSNSDLKVNLATGPTT